MWSPNFLNANILRSVFEQKLFVALQKWEDLEKHL